MAKNTVQYLEGEIPTTAFPLDSIKAADTLNVMLEAGNGVAQTDIREVPLTVMSEWGVPNIVAKGDSLDEVLIQSEKAANIPSDL